MEKVYLFNDKHYCKVDISEWDPLYAGDLDDLWDAMCDSGYYWENTFYCTDEYSYEFKEDLIDAECEFDGSVE